MSWFDTSSFSSFAKTALSQAQNLQKSIDRVLEIEDESSSTASRPSGKHVFTLICYVVIIFYFQMYPNLENGNKQWFLKRRSPTVLATVLI